MSWNKEQVLTFNLCKSACVIHKGEYLRFLTLTSTDKTINIFKSFQSFVKVVKSLSISKLLKLGYLSDSDLPKFYLNKNLNKSFDFEYVCIRTSEGVKGVLHILYFGDFLPKRFIRETWLKLSNAYIIDIRIVANDIDSINKISSYVSSQDKKDNSLLNYVSFGQSQFVSVSFSKHFCFPSFRKFYYLRRKQYFYGFNNEGKHDEAYFLSKWNAMLRSYMKYGELGLYIRKGFKVSDLKEFV